MTTRSAARRVAAGSKQRGRAANRHAATKRRRSAVGYADEQPDVPDEVASRIMEFVPEPPQVAAVLGGMSIGLWRAAERPRTLRAHQGHRISEVTFFPDGTRLVTSGDDGSIVIWDAVTGRQGLTIWRQNPESKLHDLRIFPDGHRMIGLSADACAYVWRTTSGQVLQQLNLEAHRAYQIRSVRVFPDGERVVTAVSDFWAHPAIVWNTTSGEAMFNLWPPTGIIRGVDITPDGSLVVACTPVNLVLWDGATGTLERVIAIPSPAKVIGISPSGAKIFMKSFTSPEIYAVRTDTGNITAKLGIGRGARGVALLGAGARFVTVDDSAALVWDMETGKVLRELTVDGDSAMRYTSVVAMGDIVSACGSEPFGDQRAVVWDSATGRRLHSLYRELPARDRSHPPCRVAMPRLHPLVS